MSRFADLFATVRVRLSDAVDRGEAHPDVDPDRLIELIGGATMLRMLLRPEDRARRRVGGADHRHRRARGDAMTGRLAGRAAIVTGGSRGLGRAIALALAADGAAVAVAGRTEQVWDERLPGTIGETVADIEAAGGRAVAVRADLTDRDDIARLVAAARDALGPITILVNNAAFTAPGRPPAPGSEPRAKAARPRRAARSNPDGRDSSASRWPRIAGISTSRSLPPTS